MDWVRLGMDLMPKDSNMVRNSKIKVSWESI